MAVARREDIPSHAMLHPHGKKVDRSAFYEQLKDPRVMRAFAGRMNSEVGTRSPAACIAWAETTFNRAASRKMTIMDCITNHGNYRYFPTTNPGSSNDPFLHEMIRKACFEGTNLSRGATGNASGSVGVGQETCRYNGERFGIEVPDKRWHSSIFPQFLVDVAQAIYNGAKAIGEGIYNAGKWVVDKLTGRSSTQQQAPPHADPRHAPPAQDRYQGDRQFEPTVRAPEPHRVNNITMAKWTVNKPPEYNNRGTDEPAPQATVAPRP